MENLAEGPESLVADLGGEGRLDVSDARLGGGLDSFAFRSPMYADGAPIVGVGTHGYQAPGLEVPHTFADCLLGDPTSLRQHRRAGSLLVDEPEDAPLRATEDAGATHPSAHFASEPALEPLEEREKVRKLVNHVDNLVNRGYYCRMSTIDQARTWPRTPLGHRVANMTTRSLERAAGILPDGTAASVVVKTLQPASASPLFEGIPQQFRASVLRDLHWLDEPRVYRSGLADAMPDGLRMPIVHAIDEEPDLVTLWLEDVDDTSQWDAARYRRSAAALARLGARWPGDTATERLGMGHRSIATLYFGKVVNNDLSIQSDNAFWADPLISDNVDDHHRADLFRLAELMPEMIASLEALPRGMCHGDAAPDNLREPGDSKGPIVAIDWSYGNVDALGSDLGQLLVGRFDEGREDLDTEVIAGAILEGFLEGLGDAAEVESIERAFATHLAIRSVFGALLLDRPDLDESEQFEILARRALVARYGLDAALRCATTRA